MSTRMSSEPSIARERRDFEPSSVGRIHHDAVMVDATSTQKTQPGPGTLCMLATLNPHTRNRRMRHPKSSWDLLSAPPATFR
jgi:hypothetical protein